MQRNSSIVALAALLVVNATAQDRMPPIPADKQTAAQKKAIADYKDLRKADLTGPPWTVLLRVPDLIVPSLELRLHNQTANNPWGPGSPSSRS
jgi:4-carboxymuconolactone decarboxylase